MLNNVENGQLAGFLQSEHPQTAALILSHVLGSQGLPKLLLSSRRSKQEEVVYRLATMGKTSPSLVQEIESVVRDQVGSVLGAELHTSGGVGAGCRDPQLLKPYHRAVHHGLPGGIAIPCWPDDVKSLMFVFDDLINVSDRDLQKLLSQIDQRDLILSLKGSNEELHDKLMGNVSDRAAAAIKEELELLGPVKMSEIEEAQRRIIEEAQNLEEREEISLAKGETSDELVL